MTLNLGKGVQKGKLGFPVYLKSGPNRGRIGFLFDARQYLPHGSSKRSGTILALVMVVKKQAVDAAEVAEIDYLALTKVLACSPQSEDQG